ncbi:MAG: DUF2934 domain-containing protein [Treponema sp.]|nr:DUF2934 domain-containing protein [Treponema sp.]
MKKQYLLIVFLFIIGIFAYADTAKQEEIDYLLFLPNSSNEFVDEVQAMIQLDDLSKYLISRNPDPGQIDVYGYAASANNEINSVDLSKARAVYVIDELVNRGVPREFFSDPVGYGSVDLWGSNTDENGMSPNRRVRILINGSIISAADIQTAVTPVPPPAVVVMEPAAPENPPAAKNAEFPWPLILLIILILLALLIFALSRRKKTAAVPVAAPVPAAVVPVVVAAPKTLKTVNLDDEIRMRAYELFQERGYQHGYAGEDWFRSVQEISAKYESDGYSVYRESESWWAKKYV